VVEKELGQGGMGVVYQCLDKVGGVRVAVKALPPELSHNSVEMEEVRENFELVYRLSHPNIAGVRTLERDGKGEYFLVMEVAEGMSLRKWMREKRKAGGVSPEEAVGVLRQVAAALDYAHSKKVVHRDVKPGNVMIAPNGEAKVLDFGLAAQIRTSLSRASQAYRGTSGTGPYMAPEQWRAEPQDAKTDQYALAVMAYEMLAGRLPFENAELAVLKDAVLHGEAKAIPGVPKGTMAALRRGMAKDAGKRFGSCGEFVEALGGKGGRRNARSRTLMGWEAVLVVVAGVAGAGVWLWGGKDADEPSAAPALALLAPPEEETVRAEEAARKRKEEEVRLGEQKAAEAMREAERKAAEEKWLEERRAAKELMKRVKEAQARAESGAREAQQKAEEAERRAREAETAKKQAEEKAAQRLREWEKRLANLEQPERKQVFLQGDVPNPGAVFITTGPETTVTRLVLAQGGVTKSEYPKSVELLRRAADGSKKLLRVNVQSILERDAFDDDIPLKDGDVIVVPEKALWRSVPPESDVEDAKESGDNAIRRMTEDERVRKVAAKDFGKGATMSIDLGGGVVLEMVHCPGVSSDFWMGKYEVTQEQWKRIMGKNPSWFKSWFKNSSKKPVETVSWHDCKKFVQKLNGLAATKDCGLTFRLPTEEEWDAADRGYGMKLNPADYALVAQYGKNWDEGPVEVGSFKPNEWGLYDMLGNVWEWTETCVNCGGSFDDGSSELYLKLQRSPDVAYGNLGLRLAATGVATTASGGQEGE
jgi:hypothetical protein